MRLRRRQGVIGCKNRVIYKQEAPPGQKNNQNGLLQTGSPPGAFHIKNGLLQTGNASGICQTAERFSVCSNPFLVVFLPRRGYLFFL
jgi:hypothetical protein